MMDFPPLSASLEYTPLRIDYPAGFICQDLWYWEIEDLSQKVDVFEMSIYSLFGVSTP